MWKIALAAMLAILSAGYVLAQAPIALPHQDPRSQVPNGTATNPTKVPATTGLNCKTNPRACLTKIQGSGKGTCATCPSGRGGSSGGGGPGDPILYQQESIPIIYQNLAMGGFTSNSPGLPANDCTHTGLGTSVGFSNGDLAIPNVFGSFVPDATLATTTWYNGDGDSNAIGSIGSRDAYDYIGVQGDGIAGQSTIGIALDPGMVAGRQWDLALIVNHNFCSPFPAPWANGYTSMQIATNITIPWVWHQGGDGLIGDCSGSPLNCGTTHSGISFGYFTILLKNSSTGDYIFVLPRIFQSNYPQGQDVTTYADRFGPGPGVSLIPGLGPAISPRIGIDPQISNCGSQNFQAPFSGSGALSWMCVQINTAQLSNMIAIINATSGPWSHSIDTTASNWTLILVNLDFEAWNHGGGDNRMGLNEQNFVVSIQ